MPAQKKKMLILAILGILRDGTDPTHRIRQAEIMERLERDYALTATRKSVRKNLGDLQDAGYPVVFNKGWYYDPLFDWQDLDLLAASAAVSSLSAERRNRIISRLEKLGGPYYHVTPSFGGAHPVNAQSSYTLDLARAAIAQEKQMSFRYGDADIDREVYPRLDESGKPIQYRVSPYRLELVGGRFSLICSMDREKLVAFRINRILDARILKADSRPIDTVENTADPLEKDRLLPMLAQGITGKPVRTRFIMPRGRLTDLLDWFGINAQIEGATDTEITVSVLAVPAELEMWLRHQGIEIRKT